MNWQTTATGGCTTTFTSSSYIPTLHGVTCIYSPGFVGGRYANNAACTWIVPKKDKCSSLHFILVVKDLAHNEQNGKNCARNDHLDIDNGRRFYCDRQERSNCPYNNCPSAIYTTGAKCVSENSVLSQFYNDRTHIPQLYCVVVMAACVHYS